MTQLSKVCFKIDVESKMYFEKKMKMFINKCKDIFSSDFKKETRASGVLKCERLQQ